MNDLAAELEASAKARAEAMSDEEIDERMAAAPTDPVWICRPNDFRDPGVKPKLRYHTSEDCPMPAKYGADRVERAEAEARGYKRCRRNGPCNSATKAGPRPGRSRQMVTGGS